MIPFDKQKLKEFVSQEKCKEIYEKIKTDGQKTAVIKMDGFLTDSPTIFNMNGCYYMYFISISKDINTSGYETHLARSTDLLNWEYLGTVFRRNGLNRWDSKQCAGYAAYVDINFCGGSRINRVNGKYYISYLAGNSDGYEPDPLFMGMASTDNPTDPDSFTRFPEPILRPDDKDIRPFEDTTLYKSFIFEDKAMVTGYRYVNIYNAKAADRRERIFLAVSNDGENFERYGESCVFCRDKTHPETLICGDPQIVKIDDVYVMFYFVYVDGKNAYNTFACSYDLVNWTDWEGEPLVKPDSELDDLHAHKSFFVRKDNENYHFYCAVNLKGERCIAVAVSK